MIDFKGVHYPTSVILHLVAWVAEIGEEASPDMLKVAPNAA